MSELYIYASPPETMVTLRLDDGRTTSAGCSTANGRADAHVLDCPDNATRQGAALIVEAPGADPFDNRGIFLPPGCNPWTGAVDETLAHLPAMFLLDDVRLKPAAAPPTPEPAPEPKPDPNADPMAIINAVYARHEHDLNTKEGCGEFTHECCLALHAQQSAMWGHIRKQPGQNQWDEHAVDAVMLLAKAGETDAGIYDIIHDSESANANPVFNYKGEPDSNLWMDPAEVPA